MSGYFGNEMQQRLQAQAEAMVDFINSTPGACQTGRTMGCDEPDQLGWGRIEAFLARDGVCGFRLIPASEVERLKARLAEYGCRFDTWNVFVADQTQALRVSEGIISKGLPDGFTPLDKPTEPEGEYTRHIQTLMGAAGVVPFSGSMLVGASGPATTVVVGDRGGNLVAAAHGYMPHNTYSDYHRHAWGGLVAVREDARGKGLGNYINAAMVVSAFRDLDATHIYELVSASNLASRRMVEACGLHFEPDLVCGIATANEGGRFTR